MRLYDIAKIIRSKNAGPFTLTIDLIFNNVDDFESVLNSPGFTPARIAELYHVQSQSVRIRPFERVLAIKIAMPRPVASSGSPGDTDVYGSQQHFPLANVEILNTSSSVTTSFASLDHND